MQVTMVDISRAYFNTHICREVFFGVTTLCKKRKSVVGQLVKCMRGTCDAPHGWENLPCGLRGHGLQGGGSDAVRNHAPVPTPVLDSPWRRLLCCWTRRRHEVVRRELAGGVRGQGQGKIG